jgi:hypothetical protein
MYATVDIFTSDGFGFEVSKGGPKRREVVTQFGGSHTRLPRSRGRSPRQGQAFKERVVRLVKRLGPPTTIPSPALSR